MPVHSFEVSHINSEQEKVNNVIGAMKTTYDQFSRLQNPTNIVKHVNVSLGDHYVYISGEILEVKNVCQITFYYYHIPTSFLPFFVKNNIFQIISLYK